MTDMTLADALAEVKRAKSDDSCDARTALAMETVLNAAASGDLIPRADADMAVALAVEKAAGLVDCGCDADSKSRAAAAEKPNGGPRWMACGEANCGAIDAAAILAISPTDALAEVQALRKENADLRDAVSGRTFTVDEGREWKDRAEAAKTKLAEWQASQHYSYIGRDGKTVLARDLEDQKEAAETKLAALVEAGRPFMETAVMADSRALIRAVDKLRAALAAAKGDAP